MDPTIYKSHPLYAVDPNFLQIMLYYDDVEICNPLGSRAKKHKLGNSLCCLLLCYACLLSFNTLKFIIVKFFVYF